MLAAGLAALLSVPLGKGDLPGYDDALYAHMAKGIYLSGDWLHLKSNGYPALEHPPMLPWMEAALFHLFGLSDFVARIPSAACGFGTVLLVWWLTQRMFAADETAALLAMFSMGTTLYFLKYAARAMTDVPFAFFFLCAICCWKLFERRPGWLLAAGVCTAATQMTRGMAGLALPAIFLADALLARRKLPMIYTAGALALAFAPPALWYWHLSNTYGEFFTVVHRQFLARDLSTPDPSKPFVFLWMLAKSYWPWLPVTIAGLYFTRNRLLLLWIAAVFAACAVIKNPVLRYLLPAYPAFAIASGAGLRKYVPRRALPGLLRAVPATAGIMAVVAVVLPARPPATDIRRMAASASGMTAPDERVAFYDEGAPRFDESNLLQWYGDRNLYILENREALARHLDEVSARVFIVDRATFDTSLRDRYDAVETGAHFCTARRRR